MMMYDINSVIPSGLARRLILRLLGWRWTGTGYQCGSQYVSEEELDTMSEERWQAFTALWLVSAN
jgi:hypothetical protein